MQRHGSLGRASDLAGAATDHWGVQPATEPRAASILRPNRPLRRRIDSVQMQAVAGSTHEDAIRLQERRCVVGSMLERSVDQ